MHKILINSEKYLDKYQYTNDRGNDYTSFYFRFVSLTVSINEIRIFWRYNFTWKLHKNFVRL